MDVLYGPFGEVFELAYTRGTARNVRPHNRSRAEHGVALRWLVQEPRNRRTLRRILGDADGVGAARDWRSDSEMLQRLDDALERGRLTLAVRERATGMQFRGSEPVEDEEANATPLCALARAWVAVEVVDDDGAPMPGVSYEIRLPDGSTVTGKTDRQGRAYVDDTQPGECSITLPELDETTWAEA